MAAGWLKTAVTNAQAPKVSIIGRLKQNVGGPSKPRSMAVVHASDVTKPNFCPRKWVLILQTNYKPKHEYISTALQVTFDVGNITADYLTEEWLGKFAIGHWHCRTCGDQRSFCSKPGVGCYKQIGCNWKYEEVNFVSQEYGVSGSIDVMVDLGSLSVQATELKIIKPEDFAEIKQPLPEHEIRTALYLKLISDSDSPYRNKINMHEARVLYTSRGYGKKNDEHNEILPWKEFVVKRDDERILPLLRNARQIKVWKETGAMPSGRCTLPTDKCALTCPMRTQCFSGDFPAQQPDLEL